MTFQVFDPDLDAMREMEERDLEWMKFEQKHLGLILEALRIAAKDNSLPVNCAFALAHFEHEHAEYRERRHLVRLNYTSF